MVNQRLRIYPLLKNTPQPLVYRRSLVITVLFVVVVADGKPEAQDLSASQKHSAPRDLVSCYDIFNCNWVATRWQLFSTHVHTNNIGNVTKQTIHRATQKIHRATQQLGRVRAVPRLCGFYPGICPTTEEKARKNLSLGSPILTYNENT